jgi:hypothetical protein
MSVIGIIQDDISDGRYRSGPCLSLMGVLSTAECFAQGLRHSSPVLMYYQKDIGGVGCARCEGSVKSSRWQTGPSTGHRIGLLPHAAPGALALVISRRTSVWRCVCVAKVRIVQIHHAGNDTSTLSRSAEMLLYTFAQALRQWVACSTIWPPLDMAA